MLSRGLCVGLILLALPAMAAERYAAQLQDGTRVEEAEIKTWHDVAAAPTIGGKPIFDAGNPARWIIDRHQPPGPPAPAYVEFVGGDRLAGTVVGVQTTRDGRSVVVDYVRADLSDAGLAKAPAARTWIEGMAANPTIGVPSRP